VASIYKVKIGKQGRIVLPKELREAYQVNAGDEAVIIVKGQELSIHLHKSNEEPMEHFIETSKKVSIGLSTEELKEFEEKERMKDYKSKG
jgi:AbrB family looped-hinge helix DNA binding protein